MDYTPWGTQYPDCLKWPPSQNNVTRDLAVLSQLTNKVRLYGTDCNATEMVLHSIEALGLADMKVWLGVWQDGNATDNSRQLDELYRVLDAHGADPFAGVIVGNEVLFRKDMTPAQLTEVIMGVRSNLTAKKISLPVATSDLGDNWTSDLASQVDIVMANVHPFFAGVTVDQAAGWTWDFWQTHDVVLSSAVSNKPKNIISEVGWPSAGGNDCGNDNGTCATPTEGSIAGITEMNTFMDSFVCQSLSNGTEYFWSAEPCLHFVPAGLLTPAQVRGFRRALEDPVRHAHTGLGGQVGTDGRRAEPEAWIEDPRLRRHHGVLAQAQRRLMMTSCTRRYRLTASTWPAPGRGRPAFG